MVTWNVPLLGLEALALRLKKKTRYFMINAMISNQLLPRPATIPALNSRHQDNHVHKGRREPSDIAFPKYCGKKR